MQRGTATRDQVYHVIDGEREYQNQGQGNAKKHGSDGTTPNPPLSPGEGLLCMEKILNDAREAWYKPDGQEAMMPFVRKIAAVAVQLMENYGAPSRCDK